MPATPPVTVSIPLSWKTRHEMNAACHKLGETVSDFVTGAVRLRLHVLGIAVGDNSAVAGGVSRRSSKQASAKK